MKQHSEQVLATAPEAIFIDLDNTLYAYNAAHEAAMLAVSDKVTGTFSIAVAHFSELFSQARKNVKQRLNDNPSARSRLLYFQEMLELMGLGASVFSALDFEQTYWRSFLKAAPPFAGVSEFFDDARLRGIPLVLITNLTTRIQLQKLVYMGFDESFAFVVSSEQIGVEKPDAAIFEAAVERIKCDAKNVWMIGDDIEADMIGAKQALGCTTILKTNGAKITKAELANVDVTFDAFADLSAALEKAG